MSDTKNYKKTKNIALLAVFVAIIIIQTVVPFLGFIPLGVINATIIHITVIVATLLLGLKSGMFLGFIFGLSSLLKNTFAPTLVSFCFSPFVPYGNIKSVFVSIVPRIMIAVVSYGIGDGKHIFTVRKRIFRGNEYRYEFTYLFHTYNSSYKRIG